MVAWRDRSGAARQADSRRLRGAPTDASSPARASGTATFLKDTAAKGIHKVVNYGAGVTDVHGIVKKVLGHGYSGYLLIEQAPPLSRDTLVADMTRAHRMFKPYEK